MKTAATAILVFLASLACLGASADPHVLHGGAAWAAVEDDPKSSSASDSLQTVAKGLYITPYVGEVTLVGNFGLEIQHKHIGYSIGIFKNVIAIDNSLCAGVK